jgi:hypothetical protein
MKNQIKKILREVLLNEILSPEAYHLTNLDNLLEILETNRINLSTSLGTISDQFGNKPFFLSVSRTKSLRLGYMGGKKMISVIVLDGNKLNNNFKSLSVDYWGSKSKTRGWSPEMIEYEDRIISDKAFIDNIKKYIIRVDILVNMPILSDGTLALLKDVLKLGNDKNIPINLYGNDKDLMLQKNKINDEILNSSTDTNFERKRKNFNTPEKKYNNLVALLLYDNKYINDYDLFKTDLDNFFKENDIELVPGDSFNIYDKIKSIYYNRGFIDAVGHEIHSFFTQGKSGKFRDLTIMLYDKMRKNKATTIDEYVSLIILGKRPKLAKPNKRVNYKLYILDYNNETSSYDTWKNFDTNTKLKDLRDTYFNTYGQNGYLTKEDFNVFIEYRQQDKTIDDFIQYLLKNYTENKVKEIIHNSSYDYYDKKHFYKISF